MLFRVEASGSSATTKRCASSLGLRRSKVARSSEPDSQAFKHRPDLGENVKREMEGQGLTMLWVRLDGGLRRATGYDADVEEWMRLRLS